ncbi:MAG TPA: glycosyltransferase family 1 protein, partial [Anaerolineales bacterium]
LDARAATPHFPGIGRYVNNLLADLPGLLRSDEQLVCLYENSQSFPQPTSQLTSQPPSLAPLPSPFSLSQQWRVPHRLHQLRASLYHSPYYLMPYRPGVPTVLTVYDLIPVLFPGMVSPRAARLFRLTTALALRAADRVIAISESARQDYIRAFHLPPEKILAIPLATGSSFYPRAEEEIAVMRQRYDLLNPYALYVGINKPHKNLERLVEAWAQLPKDFPTLVISGVWDPKYPEAKAAVERLGLEKQVRLMGPVEEASLPALYSGADLFVFPSLYEGFGLPVLEALACGAPVACARTSSLPEVAGEAALYFDPLDVGEIARAVLRIYEDAELRRQLRQRGLDQAKKFSWPRTAHETCQVYRSLL